MSSTLNFLGAYLRNWRSIGSVLPSSDYLARLMLRQLDFHNAETIIELGAGTGAITKHIITRKEKETHLLVFEPYADFVPPLEKLCSDSSNVSIIQDIAQKLPDYLKQRGLKRADYIFSSLPLAGWEKQQREDLFSMLSKHIWKGGMFIQYQYFAPTYTTSLKSYFREVKLNTTLMNFPPPTWVYACRNV